MQYGQIQYDTIRLDSVTSKLYYISYQLCLYGWCSNCPVYKLHMIDHYRAGPVLCESKVLFGWQFLTIFDNFHQMCNQMYVAWVLQCSQKLKPKTKNGMLKILSTRKNSLIIFYAAILHNINYRLWIFSIILPPICKKLHILKKEFFKLFVECVYTTTTMNVDSFFRALL